MKKGFIYSIIFLMALSVFWVVAQEEIPPPDGEQFWTYISKTNPYTEWTHWPGYEDIYPGKSPHGAYLKIYVNDTAFQAIQNKTLPMPTGSIIVKENYGDDKETLMAVTPMYKVADFNPESGNWFWGKYGADGSVQAAGKVQGCIDCHRKAKDKDWLFTEMK